MSADTREDETALVPAEEEPELPDPCETELPLPELPDKDGGMTDKEKQETLDGGRAENKRIVAINELLAREVKRLRVSNGALKQKITSVRFREKMMLEQGLRPLVAEREKLEQARIAEKQAQIAAGLISDDAANAPTTPQLLNHLCHLRGWPFPADEYKQVPVRGGGAQRCHFVCIMRLKMGADVEEYEGNAFSEKKVAKQDTIEKILLGAFPECDDLEGVKRKVKEEQMARKARHGPGGFTSRWKKR